MFDFWESHVEFWVHMQNSERNANVIQIAKKDSRREISN